MLVYFEIDKTMCILGAKFIKRIIGGNALIEGAAVMIDHEGQEYQADRLQ
jgi:hemin uptake protein HemP